MYDGWGWRPYVSVAERRLQALREMDKRRKKGHVVSPVTVEGRAIVKTFWGKSWCDNLERYSDFANRLPRGRTYVRNGSVIDLQIAPGEGKALVSGSQIYKVAVKVAPVTKARWKSICEDCAGAIDSLVELLQGRHVSRAAALLELLSAPARARLITPNLLFGDSGCGESGHYTLRCRQL